MPSRSAAPASLALACLVVSSVAVARVIVVPPADKHEVSGGGVCTGQAGIYGDVREAGVYCADEDGTALSVLSAGAGGSGCILSNDDSARIVQPGETVTLRRGQRGCAVVWGRFSGAEMLALGMKIDINRASAEDLVPLNGVGPVLAARVVSFRTKNGPFRSTEGIAGVPGIGPVTFEKIRDQIAVDGRKERAR